MPLQLIAFVLIFLGEAASIAAELFFSRGIASGQHFLPLFLKMFLLVVVGGGLLLFGYMLGYANAKNIWVIAAVSVGSIVIVEPLLMLYLFGQTPTLGAAVGFTLGVLGILATLFIK